jgi:hypothetical protein
MSIWSCARAPSRDAGTPHDSHLHSTQLQFQVTARGARTLLARQQHGFHRFSSSASSITRRKLRKWPKPGHPCFRSMPGDVAISVTTGLFMCSRVLISHAQNIQLDKKLIPISRAGDYLCLRDFRVLQRLVSARQLLDDAQKIFEPHFRVCGMKRKRGRESGSRAANQL